MSGFVGILHIDGTPVERSLLERLTEFQKFRGPDGQDVWFDGAVGFGHTLLKTCPNSGREHQPLSLDGETWIVTDCRVDARLALMAELESNGHHDIAEAPDSELILRTYVAWGDDCVHHLLGDFAFAIWDAPRQRLFCARDQMGVKPFYYARLANCLIFSNTLDCIRQHPAVSNELNDLAIADFLLCDMIQEPEATSFKDIGRLPPAHTLTVQRENVLPRRYWSLPVSEPIHHKRDDDCIEQFRVLLDAAVADRLRTNAAGILMSGGLDSSTVAASAQKILSGRKVRPGLCAYTDVFDSLIPDKERHYASLVADALQVPINFLPNDDLGLCDYATRLQKCTPEPSHSPWSDWGLFSLRQVAADRRIALTGYGGDPTLASLITFHFVRLMKNRQFGRMLRDAVQYLSAEGRFSRLYLRTRCRRWFASPSSQAQYPGWLNPDFEKRLELRQRWQALNAAPPRNHAVRPVAFEATVSPMWPVLFDRLDAGATGIPVEVRHPFFDLRLVKFLLALPALPLCSDKELLRNAMRGVLPDAVRLRRKSPLVADPLIAVLQRPESASLDSFVAVPDLNLFVRRNLVPKVFKEKNSWNAWIHLRPVSLNFWLRSQEPSGITASGAAS